MITIKEIHIENLGPIESYHYVFPTTSGTFAIRGKNGKGKSHLVEAIRMTATNLIMPEKPRGAVVRNYGMHGETAKVIVDYEVNGTDILSVTRTITPKRSDDIAGKLAIGAYPDATTKHGAQFRDQKCAKAGDVEELVSTMFGMTNPVQSSSVFVLQNKMGTVLAGGKTEREAAFQFLSGADVLAETNRYATKRLVQFPVSDFSEDIALAADEVKKCKSQLAEAREKLANCGEKIDTQLLADLHRELGEIESTRRALAKQERAQEEVMLQVDEAKKVKAAITDILAKIEAAGGDADAVTGDRRRIRTVYDNYNFATTELANLQALTRPPAVKELEKAVAELRDKVTGYMTERKSMEADLKKFGENGQCPTCGSDGKCPECGAVINETQTMVSTWKARTTELSRLITETNEAGVKAKNALEASRKFWTSLEKAEDNHARADAEVQALIQEGVIKDLLDIPVLLDALQRQEQQQEELRGLKSRENTLRRQMDQILATIDAIKKNMDEVKVDFDISPEREAKIREDIEAATGVANTRGRLEGTVSSLEMQLEGAESRHQSLVEKQDGMAKTKRVADYLQAIKAATNPSAIPKDRAIAYIERLNKYLEFYCQELKMPFNLVIDANYLELMVVSDDYCVPARHRLSEGQKTMASWVWHLALYAMHGSRVGFLVMDEPTVGLDADNRQRVADAIRDLNSFCTASGLQLIMITHDIDLTSAFSHQIDI